MPKGKQAAGPLSGLVVLDLTWVLAGPYASMILRDLGADVIKVERPPFGDVARTTAPYVDGESGYFFSINRGKKSVCLDLKLAAGRDLFLRLAEKADVVMENFTPGTMDALGLGYDTLSARTPRLVYAATSGFGQTGPDRLRPALDIVVQGMGGIMSITGEPGGPPVRPGISLGDIAAGLYTAIGLLAALHEREESGRGQMVDISMLDCQIAILENAFMRYFATGDALPGLPHEGRLDRPRPLLGRREPVGAALRHDRPPRPDRRPALRHARPAHGAPRGAGAAAQRGAAPADDRGVAAPVRRDRPALRPPERYPPGGGAAAGEGARDAGGGGAPLRLQPQGPRYAGQAEPHAGRDPGSAPGDRPAHGRGADGAAGAIDAGDRGPARGGGGIRAAAQPGGGAPPARGRYPPVGAERGAALHERLFPQ